MSTPTITFDDGASYERMMGTWSRLVGTAFIDWLSPQPGLRWIDIGCGNAAFTDAIVQRCAPLFVEGVDPSTAQLDYARQRLPTSIVRFQQGNAMALPFADATFDAAVMALVVFFIPDPTKGVAEMARVIRPGGIAAAYVWDAINGGGPSEIIVNLLRDMGHPPPKPARADISTPEGLQSLWTGAGLHQIDASIISARRTFDGFEDYWSTTTAAPNIAPTLKTMTPSDIAQLKSRARDEVPADQNGSISIDARANAIVGRRPL